MKMYCVKVNNDKELKKVLQLFEQAGIKWYGGEEATDFTPFIIPCYLHYSHEIRWGRIEDKESETELSLEQFRLFIKWKKAKKQFKKSLKETKK